MGNLLVTPDPLPQELMIHIRAEASKLRCEKRRRQRYTKPTVYVRREEVVRDILETLTRHEWPSCRPSWLVNPYTSKRMEIDCLCEPLRACCEVDGQQHYTRTWMHKTQRDFEAQKRRDHLKDRIVSTMGYKMIRVPPRSQLYDSQLCEYLITQLANHGIH